VTELVYGYCRLKGRLDALLERFLDPGRKLPEEAALALGLAAHEIVHLDRVPAYASVNWAVDWAKGYTRAHLSGLFNAVLRRVSGIAEAARTVTPYKEGARDEAQVLSRYYSCPEWLVRMWMTTCTREDLARYLKAQARPPAVGLAVERAAFAGAGGEEAAEALVVKLAAHASCLGRSGLGLAFQPGTGLEALCTELALTETERHALYRQSFAAREALAALNPGDWPGPVWDACCGRGGKTRLILEAGAAPVLASDTHMGRLKALTRELAPDLEAGRLLAFRARADKAAPLSGPPATILLDAPCTGLGTLSRRPDIKWKRTEADVVALVRTQGQMLRQSYATLAEGGTLHYLTCTLTPEENQGQVDAFMAEHPAARLLGTWTTPPDVPTGEFFYSASFVKG
jgi:16S rRNA (cytosine967-C5)-methyltransferase